MLETLSHAAVTGSFLAALHGSIAIRKADNLEGKVAALRRQLLLHAIMLAVFAVGVVLAPRRELLDTVAVGEPTTLARLDALAAATAKQMREGDFRLALLAALLLFAVPSALMVLRELQSFVLQHRTDLMARDQAAMAKAPASRMQA